MQAKVFLILVNVLKTDYDAKISEIKNKIPNISGLVSNSPLTTGESKIPDVSNLVKKADYDAKILDTEKKVTDPVNDKYITTSEFNKLTTENFAARLTQENLVTKTDLDIKLISPNRKINSNKTKHVFVENELKKLQAFDSSHFLGKSHFGEGGTQNYLGFQPMYRYFKKIIGVGNGEYIYFWKSK